MMARRGTRCVARSSRLTTARRGLVGILAIGLSALLLAGAPSALARPSQSPLSETPTSSSPPTATTDPTEPTTQSAGSSPTTTTTTTTRATTTTSTATTSTTSTRTSSAPPPSSQPPPPQSPPVEPPPFSEAIEGASAGQEALAAEAMRLSSLVVDTEEQLAQLELQAEAAADIYRQAEAELADADGRADRARKTAARADYEMRRAREDLGIFARSTYISGSQLANDFLLLDASSPADLIERAGLLESVANSRTDALDRVLLTQARSDAADQVANEALDTKVDAEAEAQAALQESTAMLEEQQATLTTLLEQKAEYDAKFYASLVELLGPEGAAAAFKQYEADLLTQDALAAAARAAAYGGGPVMSGAWALPLAGTLSSGYGARWGTMHWGIDIAAPMFTPLYSAGDGVVVQAGPATGFGQAVYIQHDNGDVTVYGHMEVIEVVTGQPVAAGQEIALVGSQGFSTGPHLHFEVHVGGIGGTRVDPVIWLANRGIFV